MNREDQPTMHQFNRRQALSYAVSGLGLRGLATGLPAAFIAAPRSAQAQAETRPTYLIMALSDRGDPINANAPGSYVEGIVNNPLPAMAPVDMRLGSTMTRAARPWAELPASVRDRMAFVHLGTGVVTHTQFDEVLNLRGAVRGTDGNRDEMLPSMLSAEASSLLGTTMKEPVPLGREGLTFGGLPLDTIGPAELKNLFSASLPQLAQLGSLRDQALDALYADLRRDGTRQQRDFLDRFAIGRAQARLLGEQLGDLLERVSDNPLDDEAHARDQILAAVALFRLNVTPVVTVHLPFGADNHQDDDLSQEADQHEIGIGLIRTLSEELRAAQLEEQTTFVTLNVFGRTLRRNGAGGRDHNGNHHVLAAFGPRVRAGVYGGVKAVRNDFGATDIDSQTGTSVTDGDIPADETLVAAGHTVIEWMGLPPQVAADRLSGGRPIRGMVL